MAGKKITEKESSSWAGKIEKYSRKIWLAGLGVYSKIDTDGSKLFESLVKDGEKAEKLTKTAVAKQVDAAKDTAGSAKSRMSGVKESALGKWGELEGAFDKRLNSAISRLGVPSSSEVKALHSKVDALTKQIEKLTGAKVTPVAAKTAAAKPATKTAAKPLVKAAAKTAAKPAVKAAAKPAAKTAAAKPAAKAAAKPVAAAKAAAKPATKAAAKPAAKTAAAKPAAAKPATKPAAKPAVKAAAKPAAAKKPAVKKAAAPKAPAPAAKPATPTSTASVASTANSASAPTPVATPTPAPAPSTPTSQS